MRYIMDILDMYFPPNVRALFRENFPEKRWTYWTGVRCAFIYAELAMSSLSTPDWT